MPFGRLDGALSVMWKVGFMYSVDTMPWTETELIPRRLNGPH